MLTKPQLCWSNDYWERCMSILGGRYGIANPNRIHRLCLNQDRICINWNWKGIKVESVIFTRNWPDVGRVWIKLDLKWTQTHSIRHSASAWGPESCWDMFCELISNFPRELYPHYVFWNQIKNQMGAIRHVSWRPHPIQSNQHPGDFSFQLNFTSFILTDSFLLGDW